MRRIALSLAIGGFVFGAIYGLAASLGVNTDTLGAGNKVVAACQSGTLTASYATAYDSTVPGYEVSVVTINGLDTATSPTNCASKSFKVILTGSGNSSLGEVTGTTPASGTSFTASFASANVAAADVLGIHVVITG